MPFRDLERPCVMTARQSRTVYRVPDFIKLLTAVRRSARPPLPPSKQDTNRQRPPTQTIPQGSLIAKVTSGVFTLGSKQAPTNSPPRQSPAPITGRLTAHCSNNILFSAKQLIRQEARSANRGSTAPSHWCSYHTMQQIPPSPRLPWPRPQVCQLAN